MKAVMIIYNQAHSEVVMEILDKCAVRGFTKWVDVQGRGTKTGEPHYGSHAWPSKNMTTLAAVEESQTDELLEELRNADAIAEDQGLRVFVWEVQSAV
jgi:nitrogen regulatory protein PII